MIRPELAVAQAEFGHRGNTSIERTVAKAVTLGAQVNAIENRIDLALGRACLYECRRQRHTRQSCCYKISSRKHWGSFQRWRSRLLVFLRPDSVYRMVV